jgi:hypothetical protein
MPIVFDIGEGGLELEGLQDGRMRLTITPPADATPDSTLRVLLPHDLQCQLFSVPISNWLELTETWVEGFPAERATKVKFTDEPSEHASELSLDVGEGRRLLVNGSGMPGEWSVWVALEGTPTSTVDGSTPHTVELTREQTHAFGDAIMGP